MDVADIGQPFDGGQKQVFFLFQRFAVAVAERFVVDKAFCGEGDRQGKVAVQMAQDQAGIAVEQFNVVGRQGVDRVDVFIFEVTG